MAHLIGEMFYTGETPWHSLGRHVPHRADLNTALEAGGLDWTVSQVPLVTAELQPSPASQRVAIVRDDCPAGDKDRVLGVVHPRFVPLQNRAGMEVFDGLFGGRSVYETGGYLKQGKVVWLQAALDAPIRVRPDDEVNTYLLFSNSHDGTRPIDIRLTSVRVVCNNTLTLALSRSARHGALRLAHAYSTDALRHHMFAMFEELIDEQKESAIRLAKLAGKPCQAWEFERFLVKLFPAPPASHSGTLAGSRGDQRRERILQTREAIRTIAKDGCFQRIPGLMAPPSDGSWWGALNAVTAWADHVATTASAPAGLTAGILERTKCAAYSLALEASE